MEKGAISTNLRIVPQAAVTLEFSVQKVALASPVSRKHAWAEEKPQLRPVNILYIFPLHSPRNTLDDTDLTKISQRERLSNTILFTNLKCSVFLLDCCASLGITITTTASINVV
jgi:hypothetical protein